MAEKHFFVLLYEAKKWYSNKYKATPEENNIRFTGIWERPTLIMFEKDIRVVFAPTKEIGNAFIKEQNLILRAMLNFFICPLIAIILMVATISGLISVLSFIIIIGIYCISSAFLCLYLAKKCKKLEQIHKFNVDVYRPE